ncbi:MAG: ribosomal-processing cysteine protease Prp, partial [Actinomycetia bacterium]|nr:ribosomal-processing cysteine protease Prp [Actinomycetes bacterium]
VKIEFNFNNGVFSGFVSYGHTFYDVKGKDVVCSAVSTLLQTFEFGLKEILKLKTDCKKKSGSFYCFITEKKRESLEIKIKILSDTIIGSLKIIEKQYPEHLKISIKEKSDGT